MQPQLQGNKASTSHDQPNIQQRRQFTIDMPACVAEVASAVRFYLRKDAFQASSRFDVEHGFKAQTTVAFQRSLEGPVEASTAVMGRTPTAAEIVKDPSGCNRMLPKLLLVGARLASAQTGTIASHLGLGRLCFVSSTVSQETRDGSFGNSIGVQAEVAALTKGRPGRR